VTGRSDRRLVYVVYGEDPVHYQGAIFSLLTLLRASGGCLSYPVEVFTERPEWFESYPVGVTEIGPERIEEWSLSGRYRFRIKSRAVARALAGDASRLIFVDADTVFRRPIDDLFDRISPTSALMYVDEGPVFGRRRFHLYEPLRGRTFRLEDGTSWTPSEASHMWGSLLIGLHREMRAVLDLADEITMAMLDVVTAHTVEQFSLAEALRIRGVTIAGTRSRVSDYSTSGKKEYARAALEEFFAAHGSLPLEEQIAAARPTLPRRPLRALIRQKVLKPEPD
jgi:heptosyltransferase-3